jgi:hypothetical protein
MDYKRLLFFTDMKCEEIRLDPTIRSLSRNRNAYSSKEHCEKDSDNLNCLTASIDD